MLTDYFSQDFIDTLRNEIQPLYEQSSIEKIKGYVRISLRGNMNHRGYRFLEIQKVIESLTDEFFEASQQQSLF